MRSRDAGFPEHCSRRSLLQLGAASLMASVLPFGIGPRVMGGELDAEEKTPEKLPGRIFLRGQGGRIAEDLPLAVDPNDRTWVKLSDQIRQVPRISPDGRQFACIARSVGKIGVVVGDVHGEKDPVLLIELESSFARLFWMPDSRRIVVGGLSRADDFSRFVTWELAADGSKKSKLPIPETEWVQDGSPDGKWFLTWSARPPWNDGRPGNPRARPIYLFHPDGTDERLLLEGSKDLKPTSSAGVPRFSPDGQTILYEVQHFADVDGRRRSVAGSAWLIGLDGKNRRAIREGTPQRYPLMSCWSPDGRLIAVSMWEKPADAGPGPVQIGEGKGSVEIIDLNGKTIRQLPLPEMPSYQIIDWR